jgi:N-acetyl-anhydromuramyl-L-alanine amidase AmpD
MEIQVTERPSNHGAKSQNPKKVIIHAMGEYILIDKSQEKSFKTLGKDLPAGTYHASEFLERIGLSAHYLQEPNGSFIKTRLTIQGAFHAKGFNSDSIGIEVLVKGVWSYINFEQLMKSDKDWVTDLQYKTLPILCNGIIDYFSMKEGSFYRHSDLSPERKFDPGHGFHWEKFKGQLVWK